MRLDKQITFTEDDFKDLLEFVIELAEDDCFYNDGCPDFVGSRHGKCLRCKAKETLERINKWPPQH